MARRSTRKAVVIPAGWTVHNGTGLPVDPRSSPAVLFRIGTRVKVGGFEAAHWRDRASDSWTWPADSREPMDIIAFRPEPIEWVTVPRLEVS